MSDTGSKFKVGDVVRTVDGRITGDVISVQRSFGNGEYLYEIRVSREKKSRAEMFRKPMLELVTSASNAAVGLKFDSEKPDYTLVNKELMDAVASGMTAGVKKYGRLNYRNFTKEDIPRFEAALLRHVFAYLSGEEIDKDTGLPHINLVGSNLNIILWLKGNK